MIKVLISFVGKNDSGKLSNNRDGAILTALKNSRFDKVILLWNDSGEFEFSHITSYLKEEIIRRKLAGEVEDIKIDFNDITDHNEIYKKILKLSDNLAKNEKIEYYASISSGTPAMQVAWILLAESGEFSSKYPLNLIKVADPKFGKSKNIEVKLDSYLPKIISLKKENEKLIKSFIPVLVIDTKHGYIKFDKKIILLAPVEFCYYKYFADRKIANLEAERFDGIFIPKHFLVKIFEFHEEAFPNLDTNRAELKRIIKKNENMLMTTFRGNLSKLNKKLFEQFENETIYDYFSVSSTGTRGAKFYGIKAQNSLIKIE